MYNFSGIKESVPSKVFSKWDIAQHLPEAIQKKFKLTASEFILRVYKHNLKMRAASNQDHLDDEEAHGDGEDKTTVTKVDAVGPKITSYMD